MFREEASGDHVGPAVQGILPSLTFLGGLHDLRGQLPGSFGTDDSNNVTPRVLPDLSTFRLVGELIPRFSIY